MFKALIASLCQHTFMWQLTCVVFVIAIAVSPLMSIQQADPPIQPVIASIVENRDQAYRRTVASEDSVETVLANLTANDFPYHYGKTSGVRGNPANHFEGVLLNMRLGKLCSLLDQQPRGDAAAVAETYSMKTRTVVSEIAMRTAECFAVDAESYDFSGLDMDGKDVYQANHCAAFLVARYCPGHVLLKMEVDLKDACTRSHEFLAASNAVEKNSRLYGLRFLNTLVYDQKFWLNLYTADLRRHGKKDNEHMDPLLPGARSMKMAQWQEEGNGDQKAEAFLVQHHWPNGSEFADEQSDAVLDAIREQYKRIKNVKSEVAR